VRQQTKNQEMKTYSISKILLGKDVEISAETRNKPESGIRTPLDGM
jgi:hypothetical protein